MGKIVLKNICKNFDKTEVIHDLNLTINDGEFVVLVGASGCGKTTLLRIIAGIGPATSGELYLDDKEISKLPPGKRNVAMVFQNYAIYPNMSVRKNIEFGLINNKVPKAERKRLIEEVCASIGLTEYLNRKPSELSGGQRQRVALARAMVKNPSVFLMDEPLSNLDAKLRGVMRTELIELHKKLKTTFVYVTHDQVEAMSMADTIVLLDKGVIQQQGSAKEMYKDPNNIFTAQFIGTPPMNIIKKDDISVGFRPEKIEFLDENTKNEDYLILKGNITTKELLGSETLYKILLNSNAEDNKILVAKSSDEIDDDASVTIGVKYKNLYFFGKDDNRIRENDDDYARCCDLVKGGICNQ